MKNVTLRSARLSLVLSFVVLALKFAAYYNTHSEAIFSDALESIVNIITALLALKVMKVVLEPADEDHPYGHGKLEYFSSAFEGGMIAIASVMIAYEAVMALLHGHNLQQLDIGFLLMLIATGINLALGLHLGAVGRKYHSKTLQASSAHVLSDVWTSAGVCVGLGLVRWTGLTWLDPAMALVVAVWLAWTGFGIVRSSIGGLLDEVDPASLEKLCASLNLFRKPGLIDVHNLRIIRSGRFHHVDAHLVVPDFWDALKVHTVCHEFEQAVVGKYEVEGEFAFHVDPCQREYCSICELEACPIRKNQFVKSRALTVKSIVQKPMKEML